MPIVTLITDIGEKDFLTGAIKGQLLRYEENLNIIDITHNLSAFNYPQAAYVCRNAIRKANNLIFFPFQRSLHKKYLKYCNTQ